MLGHWSEQSVAQVLERLTGSRLATTGGLEQDVSLPGGLSESASGRELEKLRWACWVHAIQQPQEAPLSPELIGQQEVFRLEEILVNVFERDQATIRRSWR